MSAESENNLDLQPVEQQIIYTRRDAILHALAVGLGRTEPPGKERAYVLDAARVVPTLASALVVHTGLLERSGYPPQLWPVIEELTLGRPVADSGSLVLTSQATVLENNALEVLTEARPMAGDLLLFTLRRVYSRDAMPPAPALPSREADLSCALGTAPDQRLIARLIVPRDAQSDTAAIGDRDSEVIEVSHMMGVVCRALLQTICEFDHTLISKLSAHIVGPLAAGETLRTDMWQEANVVTYSATVVERNEPVIAHGQCVLVT